MTTNHKSIIGAIALLVALSAYVSAAPGDLDLTFSGDGKLIDGVVASGGRDDANGVAIQADGKIVVAGSGEGNPGLLARYNPDGSLDTTFGSGGYIATCNAADVAIQDDGKIVIGCTVGYGSNADFAVVRYKPDGSLDTSFGIGGGVTTSFTSGRDQLKSIAIQSDGKIVAAGSIDGSTTEWWTDRFAVARYNADGSLDTTFAGDGTTITVVGAYHRSAYPSSVAIQSDGKIIVVGSVYLGPATGHPNVFGYGRVLIRYRANGALDASFDADGIVTTSSANGTCGDIASSVAIQADGKIVVAGTGCGFRLTRYNINGSLDGTFGGGGSVITPIGTPSYEATPQSVAIRSDGKIVAAGYSSAASPGFREFAVARYNSDGWLDTTFDGDGIVTTPVNQGWSEINALALQPDGRIVGVGFNRTGGSDTDNFVVARYNDNGSLDTAFDSDGIVITDFNYLSGSLDDAVVQADGKIVAVANNLYDYGSIVRYNPDGSRDTTFGGGTGMANVGGSAVALQPDGKILTAGSYSCDGYPWETVGTLARVNQNGSLDTSFGGNGMVLFGYSGTCKDGFNALAIQTDGKILAAGSVVARYNSDGSLDTTFGGGDGIVSTFNVAAIDIGSDGKIAIAGSNYNGSDLDFMTGRLNSDGSFDTTFDGDGTATTPFGAGNDLANSVVFQPDGKIVAAGYNSVASNEDFAVVRYDLNGSLDTTFDSDGIVTTPVGSGNDTASSVAIESDGKLVAAGSSSGAFALVRYNTNGSLDATFGGGDGKTTIVFSYSNEQANGMALDGQDRAVVVGTSAGSFAIARFLLDCSSANPIDCPDFFVRQHYRDFLSRESDVPGQAHWTNEISMCSNAANRFPGETQSQCIDRKRTNTSGAFYLSNEFQNSANFLIRVNWGSLGKDRAIGRKCIVGQHSALDAVCRPLYSDYLADMAKLTQGIVDNDQLDPNAINANKRNFVNEFVTRPDFLAAYPNNMTADAFVDKLAQTTGISLTAQERSDLINKVGTEGRAAVLFDMVDGTITIDGGELVFNTRYGRAFYDQEFNPAFVFVQYLSYLRRNPDQAGYDHWLGKLNFYGNFGDAQMVRSFLVSDEYRTRFGQP